MTWSAHQMMAARALTRSISGNLGFFYGLYKVFLYKLPILGTLWAATRVSGLRSSMGEKFPVSGFARFIDLEVRPIG